jgi:hypothetical protein
MGKGYDDWLASGKPWVKTYTGGKPNYTVPESPRAADRGSRIKDRGSQIADRESRIADRGSAEGKESPL